MEELFSFQIDAHGFIDFFASPEMSVRVDFDFLAGAPRSSCSGLRAHLVRF